MIWAACAGPRWKPEAGPDVEAVTGVPVVFGDPLAPPPPGARVTWDFGDGSTAQGAVVAHAFARSGDFVVRAEHDGVQSAASVRVVARRPASAVPQDAGATVVLDQVWRDLGGLQAAAGKLGFAKEWRKAVDAVQDGLGFDPMAAEGQLSAGLDPDEGMALYTPSGDDDATMVVVGVRDEAAAEKTLRILADLMTGPRIEYREIPYGSERVVLGRPHGGGPPFVYAFRHGYLAVRMPDAGVADPAAVVRAWLDQPPGRGLDRLPAYRRAVARVADADALLYVASGPMQQAALRAEGEGPSRGLSTRLRQATGELAVAVRAGPDRLTGRLHLGLRADAASDLAQVLASPVLASGLLASFPSGALGALHLSARPAELLRLAFSSEDSSEGREDAARILSEVSGEPDGPAALARALTGHLALAAYVDVPGLVRAFLARGPLARTWGVLGAVSLGDAALADRMLAASLKRVDGLRADVSHGPEGTSYVVHSATLPTFGLSVRETSLLFAVNRDLPSAEEARAAGGLAARLAKGPLAAPEVRERQWLWMDLARAVDGLTDIPLSDDSSLAQIFMLGMIQEHIDRFTPVSEAAFTLWPAPEGLEAELIIELR